jgi:hypothetical protein
MTWGQFATFCWGTAVVLVDAVIGPLYRHLHHRSHRN